METTPKHPVRSRPAPSRGFAPGVEQISVLLVNAYLVGEPGGPWVLVDTGMPGFAAVVRHAAAARFGDRPPEAIVLTHGHFDHAGSVEVLAMDWDVPVYGHRLEMPFLTGRSDYPPHDPTVGGALGLLSRTFPHTGVDLGERARELPADGSVPGLPEWRWLHTPGHTPGHVALWRESDRTLLAGDALATLDLDSAKGLATQRRTLSAPPAPFTYDWEAARASVQALAGLSPQALAAGHGLPVAGPHVAADLARFAQVFQPPRRGRYVQRPARFDESGIVELPPRPPDHLARRLAGAGAVVAGAAALAVLLRRFRR